MRYHGICWFIFQAAIIFAIFGSCQGAFRHQFKTAEQDGFARRNRDLAKFQKENLNWNGLFQLNSISYNSGVVSGVFEQQSENGENQHLFPFSISFLKNDVVRFQMDEKSRLEGTVEYEKNILTKRRFDASTELGFNERAEVYGKDAHLLEQTSTSLTIRYGSHGRFTVIVTFSPFKVEFQRDGEPQVVLNERHLLNMEYYRPKSSRTPEQEANGMWDETFDNFHDSKPKGPESVGLDIKFVDYGNVYGVPEHTSSLSLKETNNSDAGYTEPYRLYNVDLFEYEVDSPMSQYGAIPFMQAHKPNSDVAVFWSNAAATWIDVEKESGPSPHSQSTSTHWYSESGTLDLFIFLGPKASDVYESYSALVGRPLLPPLFSIGYHQCRWNYVSEEDVLNVDAKFDEVDMPYDTIWLDIEYASKRRYFTWDKATFPNPKAMLEKLDSKSRKLIVILDPHIKNDPNYFVSKELIDYNYAVKDKSGVDNYNADCWPGNSVWVDFFNPEAQAWWGSLYEFDRFESDKNLWIWNDMNEPSVFRGPETSMHRDAIHYGGWEHRDIHNIYGHKCINGTYNGLIKRGEGAVRPFILTRSFFAGTSALAANWIGDTMTTWEHLRGSIPTVLTNGISGMAFSGADVAGFFGNPDAELFVRWYETAIFYPFFRAHAHIDTKRREPWLYGEPYTSLVRELLRIRYRLLPTWYTAFYNSHTHGFPILYPQFLMHPEDEEGFAIDDQFYVGDSGLLVKPVTHPSIDKITIYLADDEVYFDLHDHTEYAGKGHQVVPAPLGRVPVLLRGGNILITRERIRRAAELTRNDPFTLTIAVSKIGKNASGFLYLDDGVTFNYKKGEYLIRHFSYENGILTMKDSHSNPPVSPKYSSSQKHLKVERINIYGEQTRKSIKIRKIIDSEVTEWDVSVDDSGCIRNPQLFLV
ncbi:glucosidase II alpha subunit Gls2 [Schizosaccharomyces pombe]|uniref:Glucosidase 2 subunit alpha n=1 Tax=Schizosaccharomyces pombe (strain 972 / ATCC 24843) TaxID=284812 RepID=GLU2A_SCHPO|nr:glucosidase II Gls2 [Schizosaccharomyces pombe]Q9US55.1 RecName: Full=Glucosidase 2 subunit alpha; AltName: Full=Alpha-glucosidase II subunit alpha; AltName: Full=Glucosidase II gls2; AltName: Full=Glucosidase II subunit alpha; Flags: Precursor [Schizosaccharomyces pombe 972h-]CAB65603.1 glucosidase II Gls2 [Schizosaccharomyces pombe]|eukprot:NP_593490.1 glucosidase II Gls2 [Schizosaccharomyces pombe]